MTTDRRPLAFIACGSGQKSERNPAGLSNMPLDGDYRWLYQSDESLAVRAMRNGFDRFLVHRPGGESGDDEHMRITSFLEHPREIRRTIAATVGGFSQWVRDNGGSVVWYFGTRISEATDESALRAALAPWLYLGDAIAIDASAGADPCTPWGRALSWLIEHCDREGIEFLIEHAPKRDQPWLQRFRAVQREDHLWTNIRAWTDHDRAKMRLLRLLPAGWSRNDVPGRRVPIDEIAFWRDCLDNEDHTPVLRSTPFSMPYEQAAKLVDATVNTAKPYWRTSVGEADGNDG